MCLVFHQTEEHFSFLKSKRESWKNHMGINCTLPPSRDGPIAAMDTQGWGNMGLKTGGGGGFKGDNWFSLPPYFG